MSNCQSPIEEINVRLAKLPADLTRFNVFLNGDEDDSYTTEDGTAVPSIRNFLEDIRVDPPRTVDFVTVDGQLAYPSPDDTANTPADDFSTVLCRDGETVGFSYDTNLQVFLSGVKLTPGVDYTFGAETDPITLASNPGDGLLLTITSYDSEQLPGYANYASERTFPVHEFWETGDTMDSAAVKRARDAIAAEGGGIMLFDGGQRASAGKKFWFACETQNNDPTETGNITSNLTVAQTHGTQLWLYRPHGPFLFFKNDAGNDGGTPTEPSVDNVTFDALHTHNDPTSTGPGYEENSAFYHLNGVSNARWYEPVMIGSVGDGIHAGAGDLGPDPVTGLERQNRINRAWIIRNAYGDGINTNNRNMISVVSCDGLDLQGINRSYRWGKQGGVDTLDRYNPLTGVGAPAGGMDVEYNAFTAKPLVRNIKGSIWVFSSGAAAVALLLANQDGFDHLVDGIDLDVYADACRLGLFAFQGDEHQSARPRIKIRGVVRNSPKMFEALRGGGLEADVEAYDCPNPTELSYVEGRRLDGFILKLYSERGGASGAIMRLTGGSVDLDCTFRDPAGVPLQLVHDSFEDPDAPGSNYATRVEKSRIALRLDPASTVIPPQRIAVDTTDGVPIIDSGSVVDATDEPWRDAAGAAIADATLWQAKRMFARTVPDRGSWRKGDVVYVHPDMVTPGGPTEWMAVAANDYEAGEYPQMLVSRVMPGGPSDPAVTAVPLTKTAGISEDANGRLTALDGNQYAYATTSLAVGAGQPDREWIYSVPYLGAASIYAAVSSKSAPSFDKTIEDIPTRFADVDAALWFDGTTEKLRPMVNAAADLFEYDPATFGGQVRILAHWNGTATEVSFFKRSGTSDSWGTALGSPVGLVSNPSSLRSFIVLGSASDSIQLAKQGSA